MKRLMCLVAVALVAVSAESTAVASTITHAYAWGYGPFGDGKPPGSYSGSTLKAIRALNDVKSIGCGDFACYAITPGKGVLAWGSNAGGLLGNGRSSGRSLIPRPVPGLSSVREVAGSSTSGFALRTDGTVWAWGQNKSGQLGTGMRKPRLRPTRVRGLHNVISIATLRSGGQGADSVYAITASGRLWAWGDNSHGQLGDGTRTRRLHPVLVRRLSGIVSVAASFGDGVYAVTKDGDVYAWGTAWTAKKLMPVRVRSLGPAKSVSATGPGTAFVAMRDNTVWDAGLAWDGLRSYKPTPVRGLRNIIRLTTVSCDPGAVGCESRPVGVRRDGTLWWLPSGERTGRAEEVHGAQGSRRVFSGEEDTYYALAKG